MEDAAKNPFGSQAIAERNALPAVQGETASTAVAAQARAMIESRYVMAMRNPRNMDQVRQDLLKECRRPSFAHNKSTLYHKPIGKGVEGLGIRFVEVALRCYRNVLSESIMVYADAEKEIHRVCVTDLENNNTWPMDITVTKTVERSKPADDGSYISVRKNSYGNLVYTVPANDDDLLNKRLALISKALRTAGLRIIPGDLQDEAEEIIRSIRLDQAAKDPDAERKRIADAFGELGVKAANLAAYLGHSLDSCTPAELVDLRGLYGALRDGEATWQTVMENKRAQTGAEPGAGIEGEPAKPKTGAEALKAAAKAKPKAKEQTQATVAAGGERGERVGDDPALGIPGAGDISDVGRKPDQKPAERAEKPHTGGSPDVTYEKLKASIKSRLEIKDKQNAIDLVDADASLIGEISDHDRQNELAKLFQSVRKELAAR